MIDAAVLAPCGSQAPLQAQEGDATQEQGSGTQVGIRLVDLVDRITHTIVHQFTVEVDSLTASEAYEVIVSSDTAALGIDSCGATSQTQLVTGTASHAFKVIVYACAVAGGTVTAEVRRSGSSSAEASASQGLTVLPIPDYVPADERPARGARGATRNVARVGTPGIVQNVQVAERGPTSFKITWSPPAGNGGEPLTGYGLLIWHEDTTQPPYNQAASIGVTDNHTFTGLQPSNTYNFRIHACNGTDSCGWWTAILEATTTAGPPASGAPTAPHSILSDQVGANSFRVRWSPHAETGGSALTGFGILVRQSGSSWDESRTVWVDEDPPHRYSVTGRDAGTTYVVKIKSCNGPDGESSCSAWSSDHRVTTTAVEVNTGTRPVQATPVDGECPYTEPGQTTWGPPQNLDVTPLEGREITLCWTPVMNAESYTVSATHNPTDQSPTFSEVKGTLTDTKMVIHLDNIYKSPSDTGLGQNKAYGFKVTAKQMGSTTTAESSIIMIIDTPITKATTQGQASDVLNIEWDSIRDIVGSSYSGGQYIIRYRKSHPLGDISKSPRMKGYFDTPETPEEGVSSGLTIGSLTNNAVYGIQLVFWHPGPSNAAADDTWVFAARHAYAWVGMDPPPDDTRVAGVPVTSRVVGKTFRYKICRDTFRDDLRVSRWERLIMDAFGTWQDAVTTDLITIELIAHDVDPCVDYNDVAREIYFRYEQSMTDAAFSDFNVEDRISYIEDLLITSDQEQVGPLGVPGIGPQIDELDIADRADNEIKDVLRFRRNSGVSGKRRFV